MLEHLGFINLPSHSSGGFDHADVHLSSGRVFVAHTANGTVEMIDSERSLHMATISGCLEASGVLCAQDENTIFAASRGAGKILLIDAIRGIQVGEMNVGPKPNGLAWDNRRRQLLVADVGDLKARAVDPFAGRTLAELNLPGRPRWCVYDRASDVFLVNIRDPAGIAMLEPRTLAQRSFMPISVPGPHGLDVSGATGRVFLACDGRALVVVELGLLKEIAVIPISGEPDAIWYNQHTNRLYCAIGKPGVVDVIDTLEFVMCEQIRTEEGAHTTAFDQVRQRLYVFLPGSCRASVYKEV